MCGPRCPGGDFAEAVAALAERLAYPLLADPLSGVRFGWPQASGAYDTFLMQPPVAPPDMVIRFGGVPTSKWLNQYLDSDAIQQVIHVSGSGQWADDAHRVSQFVQADEAAFCQAMHDRVSAAHDVGLAGASGRAGAGYVGCGGTRAR